MHERDERRDRGGTRNGETHETVDLPRDARNATQFVQN